MNNKKVFKLIKKEFIETLVDHIEYEIYEDGFEAFEDITIEQFKDTDYMVNKMICDWTDGDRFAGWMEGDLEEYDIEFNQIEEVWEEYSEEIKELVSDLTNFSYK